MFISTNDIKFFDNIQKELMSNFRQQEIEYLTVDNIEQYDEDEDIYHELPKEEIIWSNPIKLYGYIKTNTPEYTVDLFGGRYKNSIVVMIHKTYLIDMNIEIKDGEFFRWDNNLFQIMHQTGKEVQVWGQPDLNVYHKFICALK